MTDSCDILVYWYGRRHSISWYSSHVWMWELDYKESWVTKHWCFWTAVLEKTLESPFDSKEIPPAHPKGNQSWIFIGRTDAEAEDAILWPFDANNWLIGKDSDSGKDWRQEEEKATTEDEMVGSSPTRWTWVWATSGSWWWTGKPIVLQSLGSQRVRHDWATELNWPNVPPVYRLGICLVPCPQGLGVCHRASLEGGRHLGMCLSFLFSLSWALPSSPILCYKSY